MSQADQPIEWYLARDGQQHGPISAAEMTKILELGYLLPTDLVWRQGFAEWQPAGTAFPPKPAAEAPPPPPVARPSSPASPTPSQAAVAAPSPSATSDDKAAKAEVAPARPREGTSKSADPREIIAMEAARREESARRSRDGFQPGGPRQSVPLNQPRGPGAEPVAGARDAAGPRTEQAPAAGQAKPAAQPRPSSVVEAAYDDEWDDDEQPRRRFGRLAAVSILMIALLGGGAFALHTSGHLDDLLARLSFGSKTVTPTTTTAPVVTATPGQRKLSPAGFSADPAEVDQYFQQAELWKLLKAEFPDWYQERVRDAARLKSQNKNDADIALQLAEQLVTLRRKHVSDALSASPRNLKLVAASFLENLERLSKHSVEACYGFISQGETNPLIVELTRASEHTPALQRQASAIFVAIAEGRKSPSRHRSPTREDYDQLAAQLAKLGWSPADLQLFSDARSLARASPERVCKMVQDWFAAQLAVGDEEVQVRLLIEALKPVVAG